MDILTDLLIDCLYDEEEQFYCLYTKDVFV